MSILLRFLFGGKRAAVAHKQAQNARAETKNKKMPETIQKLHEMIDLLTKKSELLDQRILNEIREARRLGFKNKPAALRHLARKARYIQQQVIVDGQRDALEAQVIALEHSVLDGSVVSAMRAGNGALQAHQQNAEDVGDTLDAIQESLDQQEEVSNMLSSSSLSTRDIDPDDLEAELAQLEQEDLDNRMPHGTAVIHPAPMHPNTIRVSPAITPSASEISSVATTVKPVVAKKSTSSKEPVVPIKPVVLKESILIAHNEPTRILVLE